MEVFVTDAHFTQCWFVFRHEPEKSRLLKLSDDLLAVYVRQDDQGIWPCLRYEDIDSIASLYSWCKAPYIVFSTIGLAGR